MSLTIVSKLSANGICKKAGVIEEKGECKLVYCEAGVDGPNILIALSTYDGFIYAKAVPEHAIPAHMWHCSDIYYTPYGLYMFARDEDELIEKIKSKLKLLKAQSRLAAERMSAIEEGGF